MYAPGSSYAVVVHARISYLLITPTLSFFRTLPYSHIAYLFSLSPSCCFLFSCISSHTAVIENVTVCVALRGLGILQGGCAHDDWPLSVSAFISLSPLSLSLSLSLSSLSLSLSSLSLSLLSLSLSPLSLSLSLRNYI